MSSFFYSRTEEYAGSDKEIIPLIWATKSGFSEIVEELIAKGENVNEKDIDGNTALMFAAYYGYFNIARILLENKADVNAENNLNSSALRNVLELSYLNVKNNNYNGTQYNILNSGVKRRQTAIVKLLVEYNVNLDSSDQFIPVNSAVQHQLLDAAKILILNGANVNNKGFFGETPLSIAISNGNVNFIEFLLQHGANVDDDNLIEMAILDRKFDIVKLLLQYNAAVNETVLLMAVGADIDIIKLLLERGVDVNIKDDHGYTLLINAVVSGNLELVKLLLDVGADINLGDNLDMSPLMFAARVGNPQMVKLLLDSGADINCQNCFGNTALQMPRQR